MNADAKRDAIWNSIQAAAHGLDARGCPQLPEDASPGYLLDKLARIRDKHVFLGESWTHTGDELPKSRASTGKVIHGRGTTACITWEPTRGVPWSGMLETGGVGLLRLSLTHAGTRRDAFTPGLAVKLFVDGEGPSANVLAAHRFEGFPLRETDFFRAPLTTEVPPPRIPRHHIFRRLQWNAAIGMFEGALAWRDRTPTPPSVLRIPLEPLCSVQRDGTEVRPRAPRSLRFVLTDVGLNAWSRARAGRTEADFRLHFRHLAADVPLLAVFDEESRQVATVRVTSRFVSSEYADAKLFFQHAHQPNDTR